LGVRYIYPLPGSIACPAGTGEIRHRRECAPAAAIVSKFDPYRGILAAAPWRLGRQAAATNEQFAEARVNNPAASLSVVALVLNADIVVKAVMALLLAASVWSWAVIVEKLWNLGRASRNARDHEARVLAARSPQELLAAAGRTEAGDPTALVIAAGWAESTAPQALPETAVERRDRIERAMRLALSAELRQLETRLPFLASLASAAPFIGLFGTVWGIIVSFSAIAAENNTSLATVAPGIAEALFATAMGLVAAIPAVVAYNKITVDLGRFAGRIQGLIGRCSTLLSGSRVET
jgi:biopolymer transport protein TolQ